MVLIPSWLWSPPKYLVNVKGVVRNLFCFFFAKKNHVKSMYLRAQMELGAQIWICFRYWCVLSIFRAKNFFDQGGGKFFSPPGVFFFGKVWKFILKRGWPKEHFNDVKSLQGCEKWILRKILHRYSDSEKISTFFFGSKKNIFRTMKKTKLKMVKNNIFLVRIWKKMKISFGKIFYNHIFKKYFSFFKK